MPLLIVSISFAQAPDTLWTRLYSPGDRDEVYRILQTGDDGYLIVGSTQPIGGHSDIWVLKTHEDGSFQWEAFFGESDFWDYGESALVITDDGYLISSTSSPVGEVGSYISFMRLDSLGNQESEVIFSEFEENWVRESQHCSDGGFIHTGSGGIYPNGMDGLLVRTDGDCTAEWFSTYGGSMSDGFFSVRQTADGGFIAAGRTESYGSGSVDMYVVKTDADGSQEWDTALGGTNFDRAREVLQTLDGGYAIVGYTYSHSASSDIWLVKLAPTGALEWEKFFNGGGSDSGRSLIEMADGGFMITGGMSGQLFLLRTDAEGNQIWQTTIGGAYTQTGNSLQQTSDGGFVVGGITNPGAGLLDLWLVRFGQELGIGEGFPPPGGVSIRNVPNPFTSILEITCVIPTAGSVELAVYDVSGRLIEVLKESAHTAVGTRTVTWDAREQPSGFYVVTLRSRQGIYTASCVLIR
jgi:hypothetical protein